MRRGTTNLRSAGRDLRVGAARTEEDTDDEAEGRFPMSTIGPMKPASNQSGQATVPFAGSPEGPCAPASAPLVNGGQEPPDSGVGPRFRDAPESRGGQYRLSDFPSLRGSFAATAKRRRSLTGPSRPGRDLPAAIRFLGVPTPASGCGCICFGYAEGETQIDEGPGSLIGVEPRALGAQRRRRQLCQPTSSTGPGPAPSFLRISAGTEI